MIMLLVAGIACLALFGFQLTRPRLDAERDRRAALENVRSCGRRCRRPGRRTEVGAAPRALGAPRARSTEALAQGLAGRHRCAASPRRFSPAG